MWRGGSPHEKRREEQEEHKSSTRAAQEEHTRVKRYLLACGSHEGGYVVALGWQAERKGEPFNTASVPNWRKKVLGGTPVTIARRGGRE
jgi:hypothetical protein